jgi:hypothetical protein
MQKTFKLGSIEITVQTAQTVRDEMNAAIISGRIQSKETGSSVGYYDHFGDLCAHTIKSSGLPFDPTAMIDSPAEYAHSAYDWFMAAHKKLNELWTDAVKEVDAADSDPVTGPDPLPDNTDPNL